MSKARLVYLDTETTGLDPRRNEVWEAAAIEADGTEHVWYLPVRMHLADLIALNIGGFYDRHPSYDGSDGMGAGNQLTSPDAFAYEFARLTRGAHLVGAVPSFDASFLTPLLLTNGELPAWHHRLRCVESLVMGAVKESVNGLSHAAELMGVTIPERSAHTARGDARTVKAVYEAVMARG